MFIAFIFPTEPAPAAADMNYTIVVLGGVMVLSIIYYYFPVYGGVYWFKGPIRTVVDGKVYDGASQRGSLIESEENADLKGANVGQKVATE